MLTAFYHPGYAAPLGDHVMPIAKFGLVAEEVKQIRGVQLAEPEPVTYGELQRVHTSEYIDAVRTGEPRDVGGIAEVSVVA